MKATNIMGCNRQIGVFYLQYKKWPFLVNRWIIGGLEAWLQHATRVWSAFREGRLINSKGGVLNFAPRHCYVKELAEWRAGAQITVVLFSNTAMLTN
jgi:hypothetical protein